MAFQEGSGHQGGFDTRNIQTVVTALAQGRLQCLGQNIIGAMDRTTVASKMGSPANTQGRIMRVALDQIQMAHANARVNLSGQILDLGACNLLGPATDFKEETNIELRLQTRRTNQRA
jgi:hypothetical protein